MHENRQRRYQTRLGRDEKRGGHDGPVDDLVPGVARKRDERERLRTMSVRHRRPRRRVERLGLAVLVVPVQHLLEHEEHADPCEHKQPDPRSIAIVRVRLGDEVQKGPAEHRPDREGHEQENGALETLATERERRRADERHERQTKDAQQSEAPGGHGRAGLGAGESTPRRDGRSPCPRPRPAPPSRGRARRPASRPGRSRRSRRGLRS